ncbi:uroporphyrinogen-III C-methyltransferase [Candidatus Pseudomonas adelgestsugas]|uniref:Uroporphyrinogen-III C-methyltransferase n=1 Tax=Candidatus Pseudomonas adelgestsugas TaxID=1302376 RepID=A0ABX5R6Z6_9PSED|nr:uroporphyrinogen-III C-methyltransferase [Candidatus Pseudomonas adelgestsugas]QAX81416.1 Putative uroporphyrinogen-III C-methyltransferase [Candidatus Pseudomonas adelgestsugas]
MSDTTIHKNEAQPLLQAPVELQLAKLHHSNILAVIGMFLGVAGAAVGIWSILQAHMLKASNQQHLNQVQTLDDQFQSLKQSQQQLTARIVQLPTTDEFENCRYLITKLQGDQQRLSDHLETVLGLSHQDWYLAEAEHLIRLASLRLSALQDINSAYLLVQSADEILRKQSDPGAYIVHEQLAKSLAALRNIDQPDRNGLYLQLIALREQAMQLASIAPEYQLTEQVPEEFQTSDTRHYLSHWWKQIFRYFRIDFKPDDNVHPLRAGQSLNQAHIALNLTLEQAQWAVLNNDKIVYSRSMGEARKMLQNNFNQDNQQSKAILAQIAELEPKTVSVVTPSLAASLAAVQAYLSVYAPKASAGVPATQE